MSRDREWTGAELVDRDGTEAAIQDDLDREDVELAMAARMDARLSDARQALGFEASGVYRAVGRVLPSSARRPYRERFGRARRDLRQLEAIAEQRWRTIWHRINGGAAGTPGSGR